MSVAALPPEHGWCLPPQPLVLAPEEVHLWRVSLDVEAVTVEHLYSLLCDAERARADRFHFDVDRRHFIAARGRLRQILGFYLKRAAPALEFHYGPMGKPDLSPGQGGDDLHFNLSHSHGLALYAITQRRQVGVDLEAVRSDMAWHGIVERYFSPREQALFRQVPPSLQTQMFFTGWTRKEAFLKAIGQGLSAPIDQVEVTLTPHQPAALVNVQWNPADTERWSLYDLSPGPGYVATLAVAGDRISLRQWCAFRLDFNEPRLGTSKPVGPGASLAPCLEANLQKMLVGEISHHEPGSSFVRYSKCTLEIQAQEQFDAVFGEEGSENLL